MHKYFELHSRSTRYYSIYVKYITYSYIHDIYTYNITYNIKLYGVRLVYVVYCNGNGIGKSCLNFYIYKYKLSICIPITINLCSIYICWNNKCNTQSYLFLRRQT